ncbi:MAG: SUMF1/EgtB/PvdO family nonheme iron enzyme [Alphaproteobacteria bacterium]|nr:SUMF1/EgtB/PvdO family nonheme iron enzyme [Alphaproteobacteria bacterium]
MDPRLAALVQKHALSADVADELETLWFDGRYSVATTVGFEEGFTSVDLGLDEEDEDDETTREVDGLVDRYDDLGLIGHGGMGEVRRVRDRELNRVLAMKVVNEALLRRPSALARFVEEAQATAQLQHPSIVPVHDIGRLPDGRVWFTMKEVKGRTLGDVIREVHTVSVDAWDVAPSGWGLHRLIAAFRTVCQAVAFAHERGVVHRDLKPENTMVGRYGEVYVLDWGLAKIFGRVDLVLESGDVEPVQSGRSSDLATRMGQVAGTPAYMPPEQARGEIDRIDTRSDVYALGAMLYEILSGRAPFVGDAMEVLEQVRTAPATPLSRLGGAVTRPDELVQICERAMAFAPEDRFPSAVALAEAVGEWLDGSKRREQALGRVERARMAAVEGEALVARAVELRAEAVALLEAVDPWEPEARKARGWAKAAEADRAELAGRLKSLEVDETLKSAFAFVPDLPEAHARLAERYRARHAEAESLRSPEATAEAQTLLESHALALPLAHPLRREVTAYLRGDGALTLVTEPPGAEVHLYRYVERNRRLVEVFERTLGVTPLRAVPLPMGSYVCVLKHPGCDEVRYPVEVRRQSHWDGVPPEEKAPRPIWLPPRGHLGPDEVYVPAGWFWSGGDDMSLPMTRGWCEGFVMDRFPVTNARFMAFLDDLVARGREEEALRFAPRERGGSEGELGALIYGFEDGRFSLRPDVDGDVWLPGFPVLLVDWHGASAYLAWRAERTGRPLRLPAELEWEKAARGVDGRRYPWGDALDPSWCRMIETARGREAGDFGPVEVDTYPVDQGPTGVRGLGGNVQDWCLDAYETPAGLVGGRVGVPEHDPASNALRTTRGGAWDLGGRNCRTLMRFRLGPTGRDPSVGFRGVFRPIEALTV